LEAFRQGLKETGYIEGENVVIEYRFADNRYERPPELAADLVHRQVAVIVANGPAAMPAKTASGSIPLVFATGFDPVQQGLVASLARPGGNITGLSLMGGMLEVKRVEILRKIVPNADVQRARLPIRLPATGKCLFRWAYRFCGNRNGWHWPPIATIIGLLGAGHWGPHG